MIESQALARCTHTMMPHPVALTDEETALLADAQFFRKKAAITAKIQRMLDATHRALQADLQAVTLLTPPGVNLTAHQRVKGEHLENFPYQYLDCPKHFQGGDTFTFRTLVWWGHHLVCGLLLGGAGMPQYKRQLLGRFHQVAGRELELSLAPSFWEWKRGEGYTLPITHDRKAQIAAVLAERSFMKVVRCVPLGDANVQAGHVAQVARDTFQSLLPIVTP